MNSQHCLLLQRRQYKLFARHWTQVNCETDFVTRNEKFQYLVYRLTLACHNNLEKDASKKVLQHEAVNTLPSENKMLSDIVAQEVGTIGENMRLRRAVFLPDSNGHILSSYVHNSDKKVAINGCHLGRFGTILSVGKTSGTENEDSLKELTKDRGVTRSMASVFSTRKQKKPNFHLSTQFINKSLKFGHRNFCTSSLKYNQKLTHIDRNGKAKMVDVGNKEETVRTAVACATIFLGDKAFSLVEANKSKKGDVLIVAQLAGIMAAKRTSELIPLCHNIGLSKVSVDLSLQKDTKSVYIECMSKTVGKTGVEMEAITGASMSAIAVYDMCKAVDKEMVISNIRLLSKKGGKSGDYMFVLK
ncbi:elongation factor Ts-like isoform X5 [Ostrea edulis]|uniref:elongation factor Ts-like isoform X5 n=1 Tax=Ostrea edulis TaxID=37623 RepID=UPI0020947DE3|nr:elongation factor Ts-like isoform X5 [Ostrea edulis]XP_048778455.1 elongation factor Ts-like isoform X5 [Ostrea edulis]XP_048778456.1 elongation factor Ts-like isoform X5 [Ostrea edulis]XP_048778457.1 elongation factor Ts-like isoform X5 [Ostrea edulis]XP_048778459.1 elongation factor Ts-like isoform X5 [Ostrea edulis]XP_056010403.1 elongation factor Ts-like isoform X5 [Ostrea edulis]XP_056010404.1 elongation factor Ts-like isoform X5 [Ostrea edulis]